MTEAREKARRGAKWDATVKDALLRQKGKVTGLKIQAPLPKKRPVWLIPAIAGGIVLTVAAIVLGLAWPRKSQPAEPFHQSAGAVEVDVVALLTGYFTDYPKNVGEYVGKTVLTRVWSGRDPWLVQANMVEPVGYHVFCAQPGMMRTMKRPGAGYFYLKVTQTQETVLVEMQRRSPWLWITFRLEKTDVSFPDPQRPVNVYYCIGKLENAALERPGGLVPSGTE